VRGFARKKKGDETRATRREGDGRLRGWRGSPRGELSGGEII